MSPNANDSDSTVIDGFNRGEPDAFESVFHIYYGTLCFFANSFVGDREAARDVVQDVFTWIFEKKPRFDNLTALKSYLYSCVHNKALNWVKRDKKGRQIYASVGPQPPHEDEIYETAQVEAEFFEEVLNAVEELPDACRQVFKMSYVERLDVKSIAERLNIAETTVKTQRQRAKKMLRQRLGHLYPLACIIFMIN